MAVRKVDLDDLVDDPLEITIAGVVYRVESIPVEFAIRMGNLSENPPEGGALAVLQEVLVPLGADPEVVKAMDSRKALAAAYLIMSHFTQLPEKILALGPTPAARVAAQAMLASRGLAPSSPTAES